jgi:hypothetical protein
VFFAWATVLTYDRASPQPTIFVTQSGATLIRNGATSAASIAVRRERQRELEQVIRLAGATDGAGAANQPSYGDSWAIIRMSVSPQERDQSGGNASGGRDQKAGEPSRARLIREDRGVRSRSNLVG